MDYYKIGQKIRKIRKAHGLSQEELADKVSISTTHMSHIETGNTKLSLPVFVDIAAILDRCSTQETKVIADVVKAAKLSLHQKRKTTPFGASLFGTPTTGLDCIFFRGGERKS